MPHITKETITIELKGRKIIVPKGTRLTHKTAMGIDPKYNYVDDLSFMSKRSFSYHDAVHYGIDIPLQYVIDSGKIEQQLRDHLAKLGIDPDTVTVRQHEAIVARIKSQWDNKLLAEFCELFGCLNHNTDADIKRIVKLFV